MKLLRLLSLAMFVPSLAAAKVAVMPVEATNLAPEEADAIGIMIADAYGREAKVDVAGPRQVRGVVGASASAAAAAQTLGLEQYILVHAIRLTNKVALQVSLRDAKGEELFVVEITASSLDDMPQIAARVAKALVARKSPEEVLNRRNVTAEETVPRNRVASQKNVGFKTAFGVPMAHGLRLNTNVTLAFDLRYEAEEYFIEFAAGAMLPNGNDHLNLGAVFAELGVNRYLSGADNAPYVGLGVSPRFLIGDFDGDLKTVISPYAQIGCMLFRASRVRVYADLRVTQEVFPLKYINQGTWPQFNVTTKEVYPTELNLFVGLSW